MGEVLSWAVLENQMLLQGHNEVVSPELMRTTLLCTKRMLNAAGNKSEYEVGFFLFVTNTLIFYAYLF